MLPSYDTVNCWLPADYLTDKQLQNLLSNLENVSYTESPHWGISFRGSLENLIISINQKSNRIAVKGSLCKYHHGSNLQSLTLPEVKQAVEKIADHLHLPMDQAQVSRFDIAHNFAMDHPVPLYLPPLGLARHYRRLEQPTSLYYRGSKRELVFYDKIKELKSHKEKIPEQQKHENLLRYEQRYMRQVKNQFLKEVTAATLSEESFYRDLVKRWEGAYAGISKDRKINLEAAGFNMIEDLPSLAGMALLQLVGGERAALEEVDRQRNRGVFTRYQVKRAKDKIKEFASLPGLTTENEQVEELNAKMQEVIKHLN